MSNGSSNGSDCDLDAAASIHAEWIYHYLGECVINTRQWFAFSIGISSIFCWICAQWPQVVKSCRTGTAHESLSIGFLVLWFFSDLSNLLGTLLTKQLFTQVLNAVYYVFMDLVCISQYTFHYARHKGCKCVNIRFRRHTQLYMASAMLLLLPSIASFYISRTKDTPNLEWRARSLLEVTETTPSPPLIDVHDTSFMIGYIFGCISSLIYFFAVPLQIIKNFLRGSVEGLSILMFIFVTLGDCTYVLSIVLYRTDLLFVVQKLPWSIGSAWSFFFDIVIMIQIIFYRSKSWCARRRTPEEESLLHTSIA